MSVRRCTPPSVQPTRPTPKPHRPAVTLWPRPVGHTVGCSTCCWRPFSYRCARKKDYVGACYEISRGYADVGACIVGLGRQLVGRSAAMYVSGHGGPHVRALINASGLRFANLADELARPRSCVHVRCSGRLSMTTVDRGCARGWPNGRTSRGPRSSCRQRRQSLDAQRCVEPGARCSSHRGRV